MSLLPFAEGMPLRVTDNSGVDFKKYRISKGVQCRARALTLHETDIARMQAGATAELVLSHLPKVLFVEVVGQTIPTYPGLPEQWFPLKLGLQSWFLDKEKNVEIVRRGFPVVPNSSSTVHAARPGVVN